MLVVEGLTCRFGTKTAVDNASFSVGPGSFVGVIGRSGAGKSTMLRMINRLAEPTSGRISFDGVNVTALKGRELRKWRARSAMIFQQFNLIGRLDVLTNVLMGRLATVSPVRSLLKLYRVDRLSRHPDRGLRRVSRADDDPIWPEFPSRHAMPLAPDAAHHWNVVGNITDVCGGAGRKTRTIGSTSSLRNPRLIRAI